MFITIMHIRCIICIFHIIVHFFGQVRRHIVHTLVGGGGQHGGYDALDYRKIHQGNAGKLGNYPILSVLPDKFARFLFEYHSHRFESLDLPLLPADRSDFDVHGALLDDKVQTKIVILSGLLRPFKCYACSVYYNHYDSYFILS